MNPISRFRSQRAQADRNGLGISENVTAWAKQWRAENERIMREFPSVDQVMLPGSADVPPPPLADDQPSLPLEDPDTRPPEERPLP